VSYTAEDIANLMIGNRISVDDISEALDGKVGKTLNIIDEPKPDFESFTAKDLEEYFNQENLLEDGWGELSYSLKNEQTYDYEEGKYAPLKPFVHGKVEVADDEETGGKGSQEDIYVVFSVEDVHGNASDTVPPRKRYFMKTGYYLSYDGSNWDGDFIEVFPKQKEITVWVTKKFA